MSVKDLMASREPWMIVSSANESSKISGEEHTGRTLREFAQR